MIVLIFVACLLKAKQLELAWYRVDASSNSILVGLPTPAIEGAWAGLRKVANKLEAFAGAPVQPETAPTSRFSIGVGNERYALDAGSAIDFAALFGDRGAPAGASGEIDAQSSEPHVLILKNIGSVSWVSITLKGSAVTVPQGRSLRIAPDTRIVIGTLVLEIQPY